MTGLRTPGKDKSKDRLPQALRLLPLWGAVSGALIWGVSRLVHSGSFLVIGWILVCLDLLLGGLYIFCRLVFWATGCSHDPEQGGLRYRLRLSALSSGFLWLILLYGAYFHLLRSGSSSVFLTSMVVSRWELCCVVRVGPEVRPGSWHLGFDRRCFAFATYSALLVLLPFCSLQLFCTMLPTLAGMVLFIKNCSRRYGGLYKNAYGFFAGWAQVLFLWFWIFWERIGLLF